MVEDPTETIFDFVEFPLVDDDIVEVNSIADSQSSNRQSSDNNEVSGSLDSVYVYYSPNSRERCKWFVWRVVASRVLFGLAIVFVGLAVLMCGLGMIKSDSNSNVKERKVSRSHLILCGLYIKIYNVITSYPGCQGNVCSTRLH